MTGRRRKPATPKRAADWASVASESMLSICTRGVMIRRTWVSVRRSAPSSTLVSLGSSSPRSRPRSIAVRSSPSESAACPSPAPPTSRSHRRVTVSSAATIGRVSRTHQRSGCASRRTIMMLWCSATDLGPISPKMTSSTVTTTVAASSAEPPAISSAAIAVPTAAAPVLTRLLPSRMAASRRRGSSSRAAARLAPDRPARRACSSRTRSTERNAVSALEKTPEKTSSTTRTTT